MSYSYPHLVIPVTLDDAVTANTLFVIPTEDQGLDIEYDATPFVTASSHFAVGAFSGNKLSIAASVDIKKLTGHITGRIPHATIPFWFGSLSDPTTWYKPGANTHFQADLESSANADNLDTAYLFTEQLRNY